MFFCKAVLLPPKNDQSLAAKERPRIEPRRRVRVIFRLFFRSTSCRQSPHVQQLGKVQSSNK